MSRVLLKRNASSGVAPVAADLQAGELAINTADSKLFHKNAANTIVELGMSPGERTKLSGIAAGATANSTDAVLKDRSNHTGSQATSTITGLDTALAGKASTGSVTAIDGRVAALESAIDGGTY